jgi:folate-binding protein YgfZ
MSRETPLREQHERAGARMGIWFGTLLPSDYGDFDAEYRRGRESAAVVDTNFQLVAEFTGPDRVRYLNAITSGNLLDLNPGQSAIGLLLNPQGHILAELRTLALEDRLLALSHAITGQRTLETLDKFIIMDDVELRDRSAEFGTACVVGPATEAVVSELAGVQLAAMAAGGHVEAEAGGIRCRVVKATSLRLPGAEWLVEREHLGKLWRLLVEAAERHGGGAAGYAAVNVLRLEAGAAWFGTDFDDRVIPHEAGLEQSHISYTKGCYTGQEIVERVRSRGHANRRRMGLAFSGEGLPEAGAKLTAEGKEAGWVTSAVFSPAAGRAIGLGYLRREFHPPGTRLKWERGEAEVIPLPLAAPATESSGKKDEAS